MDLVLRNLQTLGALEPHDKLVTGSRELFEIHPPCFMAGYARGAWRMYSGENRHSNLSRIRATVSEADGLLNRAREEIRRISGLHSRDVAWSLQQERLATQVSRLTSALRAAATGIRNMKHTYESDAAICAQIECIALDIDDLLAIRADGPPASAGSVEW